MRSMGVALFSRIAGPTAAGLPLFLSFFAVGAAFDGADFAGDSFADDSFANDFFGSASAAKA